MPISSTDTTITVEDAIAGVTAAATHQPVSEALDGLWLISTTVDELTAEVVARARRGGASWAAIGAALRMTRQAAHERFRSVERPSWVARSGHGSNPVCDRFVASDRWPGTGCDTCGHTQGEHPAAGR